MKLCRWNESSIKPWRWAVRSAAGRLLLGRRWLSVWLWGFPRCCHCPYIVVCGFVHFRKLIRILLSSESRGKFLLPRVYGIWDFLGTCSVIYGQYIGILMDLWDFFFSDFGIVTMKKRTGFLRSIPSLRILITRFQRGVCLNVSGMNFRKQHCSKLDFTSTNLPRPFCYIFWFHVNSYIFFCILFNLYFAIDLGNTRV